MTLAEMAVSGKGLPSHNPQEYSDLSRHISAVISAVTALSEVTLPFAFSQC
jgi:hypothetical protein